MAAATAIVVNQHTISKAKSELLIMTKFWYLLVHHDYYKGTLY